MKAALFPFSKETLAIVKFINTYDPNFEITTLLALPGSGLCGKDAGYADNRGNIGMLVYESLFDTKNMWDVLLISNISDLEGEVNLHKLSFEVIVEALQLNKSVVCGIYLMSEEVTYLKEMSKDRCCSFTYLFEDDSKLIMKNKGALYKALPYVVFVGGLISDANSFEIFLMITGQLKKKYCVLSLSTNVNSGLCGIISINEILYSKEYSEAEKVYAINSIIKQQCDILFPDIIIIHFSEPIMEYDDVILNSFGIYPYIISKAVLPDYFICGTPFRLVQYEYIKNVSEGILNRLGFQIDFVHASNEEIDTSIIHEQQKLSVSYNPYNLVADHVKQFNICTDIKIKNILEIVGFQELYESILNELIDYNRVISVI